MNFLVKNLTDKDIVLVTNTGENYTLYSKKEMSLFVEVNDVIKFKGASFKPKELVITSSTTMCVFKHRYSNFLRKISTVSVIIGLVFSLFSSVIYKLSYETFIISLVLSVIAIVVNVIVISGAKILAHPSTDI